MAKQKVLVYVLCGPERGQWIAPDLLLRLTDAARLRDIDVDVDCVYGVHGYDMARNVAVERFLASDADWLVMCDNDTTPPPVFVPRVLDFTHTRPDVDCICLPYYMRTREDSATSLLCAGWRHPSVPNAYDMATQLPKEWQEIDGGGAGCLFIRREVLTKMERPFRIPEHAIRENFLCGPGEDLDFCQRAKAAGFHIWTNGELLCDHWHTVNLSAVARRVSVRAEEDLAMLRRLGVNIPTTQTVRP